MAVVKQLGKFSRSLIYLTMERYTNEELTNMLLIYGKCQKNQRQAAALYVERFPVKRHPGHGFFHSLFIILIQYGTLHASVDINNIPNDNFLRRILWTDECTFRSDRRINRHNEHHYAEENPHCRKETHIQGQFHVNVWMGILDNYVIGPFLFPENVNITAVTYSEFLVETLPYLLEDVPLAIIPNIIFQQDGHPAHSSLLARTILNQRFPNR
ncbi:hypothetical protein ALC57_11197 [Trachymyrmex cornetzi]|uniref:DUF4817 domain-containing protein n=1 Tax=Trachymyrmex cornetzi TaxID=471704 RepID=A0A151J2U2_9HYME|nr:hypothetical protein ALC57_11197 [Trachymyrmex cornetzi]